MDTNYVIVLNQVSLASSWDVVGPFFYMGLRAGLVIGTAWWVAFVVVRSFRGPRLPWSHE